MPPLAVQRPAGRHASDPVRFRRNIRDPTHGWIAVGTERSDSRGRRTSVHSRIPSGAHASERRDARDALPSPPSAVCPLPAETGCDLPACLAPPGDHLPSVFHLAAFNFEHPPVRSTRLVIQLQQTACSKPLLSTSARRGPAWPPFGDLDPPFRVIGLASCSLETQSRQGTVPSGTGTIITRPLSAVNESSQPSFHKKFTLRMHRCA